ncbi:MAG: DUF58 domain-containing protein [Bacteroidota bacterium]|nr:DUF58 domain-containing protein [Bacteroidota bacterium]
MKRFLKTLYFSNLLYYIIAAEAVFFVFGFFFPELFIVAKTTLFIILALVVSDILILYLNKDGIFARRDTLDKLSNGDDNPVQIYIENRYLFTARLSVLDELPFQFQARDTVFKLSLSSGKNKIIQYDVHPVKRGEYFFGAVNVFVKSPIGLIQKRYKFSQDMKVPVYPSFMQMRKYELLAISNRLTDSGIKKIRRRGNNAEFDQIKDYVSGDDYRTVNWKATARKNKLMVNQFQDERSQQVYSVIDMGRVMRMPFEGLSLLDYAINSSLVISNIAMLKQDKAGLITFSHKVQSILPADRRNAQLQKILQLLYNQKTGYLETDYENLYVNIRSKVNQRSLLLLYTNFESVSGLQRQLKYLRRLAKDHLLVVIFFENTELRSFLEKPAESTEEVYNKVIAEKFSYEKKLIVKELEKYGIHSILTSPQKLSVNTINKYLELKARGLI